MKVTLAQGRVHTKIQTRFSQKLLCWSEPNFVWKLSGTRKWKSDDMMLVTWPRWPPSPYMVKTFENLLLQNRMSYDLETWHVASGTQALQSLYKWWPWVDLDLFYGKVKFGNLGFSIGKSENSGFSWKVVGADILLEDIWVLKVKVISWPWPMVVYIQKFKLDFLRNDCSDLNQILYESFQVQGNENLMTWCWSNDQEGHPPIYSKNLLKIFFSGTGRLISTKLSM